MSSDEENTLSREGFLEMILKKDRPVFVKFTADWCGPCKRVKPIIDEFLTNEILEKLKYVEIDIDNSVDVYAFMKSRRMLNGIPTLLFYDMGTNSFSPTYSTSTGKEETVKEFLNVILGAL